MGALWSGTEKAGMWPVLLSPDGEKSPLTPEGPPVVKELNRTDLGIIQSIRGGGTFTIVCRETKVTCTGVDGRGRPLHWAWDMVGGERQTSAAKTVTSNGVTYLYSGMNYQLRLSPHSGSCQQLENGAIRLSPNSSGKLVLNLDVTM